MKSLLRNLIILSLIGNPVILNAQTGSSCSTPLSVSVEDNYEPVDYSAVANSIRWFSFVCDSPTVILHVKNPTVAFPDTAQIANVSVYTNDCSTLVAEKVLNATDSNKITMMLEGLTTSNTYKIKITTDSPGAFSLALVRSSRASCPASNTTCELISNGNFSDTTGYAAINAFALGNVCYWEAGGYTSPDISYAAGSPTFGNYATFFTGGSVTEVVKQNLQTPLIAGKKYILSYSVRNYLGLSPDLLDNYYAMFQNSNSTTYLSGTSGITRQQVYNGVNIAYSSTWVTQYVCFTANSNFNQIYFLGYKTGNQVWINLDNVSLRMVDAGADISITGCPTSSSTIGTSCSISGATYSWSSVPSGSYATTSSISVSPLVTTTYTVTVTTPNCTLTDEVTIYIDCSTIKNANFECYSTAPNALDQIANANSWGSPTNGLADFYHQAGSGAADVPVSGTGETPPSGVGMVGIRAMSATGANTRDYIQQNLPAALTSGLYFVSFKARRKNDNAKYAIRNLGAYFSNGSIGGAITTNLAYTPQVEHPGSVISTSWVTVGGCFTAAGGENYITIGNFRNDASTTTSTINPGSTTDSYYFIDQVVLRKFKPYAGQDVTIYCGSSKTLGEISPSCTFPSVTYSWSPSTGLSSSSVANPVATPTTTTTYIVTMSISGTSCTAKDTVVVTVVPPLIVKSLGNTPVGLCVTNSPVSLSQYIISPVGGTFSGTGVTSGYFNPTTAGPGLHTITYNGPAPCNGSGTLQILVEDSIIPPSLDTIYLCLNEDTIMLNGSSPSGPSLECSSFSGTGVFYDSINDIFYFDPQVAGEGIHDITCVYWDCTSSCSDTVEQTIIVDCGWGIQSSGSIINTGNSVAVKPGTSETYVTGKFDGDFYLVKFDECGNGLWSVFAGGSGTSEGMGVTVDANGNAFVTGKFTGSAVTFGGVTLASNAYTGTTDSTDIFIAKIDNSGNFKWAYKAGGNMDDCGNGIIVSGNVIYVTGYITGNNIGFYDNSSPTIPATSANANTLNPTGLKNFFLAKYTDNNPGFPNPNTGTCNSAVNFYHDNGGYSWANDITKDGSGNIYLTGAVFREVGSCYISGDESETAFVIKFQNTTATWGKSYTRPFSETSTSEGKAVITDASNNVYITGNFIGDIDFQDGGSSSVLYNSTGTDKDLFYAKLNSSGVTQWSNAGGGSTDGEGRGLTLIDGDDLAMTGYFTTSLDFYETSNYGLMQGVSNKDVFTVRFPSSTGLIPEVAMYAGSSNENGNDIAADEDGNIYVTGDFTGSMSFNHYNSTITSSLSSSVSTTAFLRKHCSAASALEKTDGEVNLVLNQSGDFSSQISVYPNPAKDELVIKCDVYYKYEIFDVTGRLLLHGIKETGGNLLTLDIHGLSLGMLLLKVSNSKNFHIQKIVKQ